MTPEILIVVPVLARPQRAQPLVDSVRAATSVAHQLCFVCSPGDLPELRACRRSGADMVLVADWEPGCGDYAMKVNYAVGASSAPWAFQAADDLEFLPGWAERALECASAASARVVGTNDLSNPRVISGKHSTHNLVARSYIMEKGTVDAPGLMLHEGYEHNFCDDELIATAKRRREYVFCGASQVRHLHPHWTGGPRDDTYDKGEVSFTRDRILYQRRFSLIRRAR